MLSLTLIGCLVSWPAEAQTPTSEGISTDDFVDEVLVRFGFDPSHKDHLGEGKILTMGLPDLETQANELAVGAVLMLVRRPLDVVADALVDDAIFRVNTEILDYRTIGVGSETPEQIETVFDAIRYTEGEDDEADRLIDAEPGTDFNLSASAFARLAAIEGEGEARRVRASRAKSSITWGTPITR